MHQRLEEIKTALYSGTTADEADEYSNELMKIAKNNWRNQPTVALKAAITMIDLGNNSQQRIDEGCKILKDIAINHWQEKPMLAMQAVKRVVNDCEDINTVLAADDLMQTLVPVTKMRESSKQTAVQIQRYR